MEENLSELLERSYRGALIAVTEAKEGSEEAQWELKKLDELHKHMMDERSAEAKAEEAKAEKKDKWWKRALDAAAILVPTLASGYWMAKALTFEQTGTFTSRAAQWVNTHLKRKG